MTQDEKSRVSKTNPIVSIQLLNDDWATIEAILEAISYRQDIARILWAEYGWSVPETKYIAGDISRKMYEQRMAQVLPNKEDKEQ